MDKVWFLPIEKLDPQNLARLFDESGFGSIVKTGEPVPIKVHFGEMGNTAYLKPENVKPISDKIISLGGKPFLTDANTLYKGTRSNAVDHINTALKHGYCFAPVVIADGIAGKDYRNIRVDLKHFKEVHISSAAAQCDSMFVMTHFKGHEVTGFGGALKNVGMGLGSRSGKQQMHSDIHPKVDAEKCTACGLCAQWCPANAITIIHNVALIDPAKCIGCAECMVTCTSNAISISWAATPDSVQEKIAEYAFGAVKGKRCAYFSFINNVSPNCDCYGFNDPPIIKDIGVLASYDPVAIDQACVDLANKKAGCDIIKKTWPDVDYMVQLRHGEEIGLGSRDYILIDV